MNDDTNGAKFPTEQEMRDAEVPWLKDPGDLIAYIDALVDRPHDYGTSVYATSMAAVAAFNYVAGKLGITGFQAGCADMDVLTRTRGMKHGFRIVNYNDLYYPQYWRPDVAPIFGEYIKGNVAAVKEHAQSLLNGSPGSSAPWVRRHWEYLASLVEGDTYATPHSPDGCVGRLSRGDRWLGLL